MFSPISPYFPPSSPIFPHFTPFFLRHVAHYTPPPTHTPDTHALDMQRAHLQP